MLYVPLKAVIVGLIDKARKFGIVRKRGITERVD